MIMQQSLWAIARSPLIYGGRVKDITTANPHIAILTNPRVLAVSDTSSRNRQVRRSNSSAVWVAETATSGFNLTTIGNHHASVSRPSSAEIEAAIRSDAATDTLLREIYAMDFACAPSAARVR